MAARVLTDRVMRLGPVVLGIIAILILVAGYFLQVDSNTRQAAPLMPHVLGGTTIFGVLSKVAGVIGLLAIVLVAVRPSGDDHDQMTGQAPDPAEDAVPHPAPLEMPQSMTHPLDQGPIARPARRFTLRRVMIAVVGGAFAFLAGAVAYDAVTSAMTGDTGQAAVQATTTQQDTGVAVSDVALDATPDAHTAQGTADDLLNKATGWINGFSDWFAGLLDGAAQGDTMAIVTLLAVVFGAFFTVIGLKKLFGVNGRLRLRLGNADFLDDLGLG